MLKRRVRRKGCCSEKIREGERVIGRGRGRKGITGDDWGLLIKVGFLDPLMKVQARGLLRSSTLMARRVSDEG